MDNYIQKAVDEFKVWKEELKKYWDEIDKSQEMYEFFKREESETQSQISLNTPFSIIESQVAKANEANIAVTVNAKGEKGLVELEKWIASIVKDALEDPDVAQYEGTFRKIREKFFRNYLVQGNAVASVEWCRKEVDGKIVANNPYVKLRNLKSVIFNPAYTLVNSNKYYIESYTSYAKLKADEKTTKNPKGIYTNLAELKKEALKDQIEIEDYAYSDGKKIAQKAEPIKLIECWDGLKYYVIANDKVVIREDIDPYKIGGHNLILAMNYVVGNRPYGYGEITPIYKAVRAQDTIINQSVDMINKFQRPGVIVNPQSGIDPDQLIDLIENGGVMQGDPTMVGNVPSQVPPGQAFTTIDTMQQAIERTARYSPYASGMTSQATDKTSGTATGIMKLQQASEPNFQIKLDDLEESFMRPVARTEMKMIANLMGKNEFRYGTLEGKTSEWVKAGKAILQGKPTMKDLLDIGYTTPETYMKATTTTDPMTGEIIPIPEAEKAIVFDIDWLIDVRLDNQSALDKDQKISKTMELVKFGQEMGVQFNPDKVIKYVAERQGEEDFEELLLTEEERRLQKEMLIKNKQAEVETEMQKQTAQTQAELAKEELRGKNQQMVAGMRTNARQVI